MQKEPQNVNFEALKDGGGEGGRTPVLIAFDHTVYMCS